VRVADEPGEELFLGLVRLEHRVELAQQLSDQARGRDDVELDTTSGGERERMRQKCFGNLRQPTTSTR
jgi:hypothetical protein